MRALLFCLVAPACAAETVSMPPPAPVHFSPAGAAAAAKPSPTVATQRERGVADAYVKALASPGLIEIGLLVGEDVRFTFGTHDTRGRQAVIKAHDKVFGAFGDRKFITSRIWLTDSTHLLDCQALEWTMTGVQERPWLGVAPAGKAVSIKGLTLFWTDDDGVISEIHTYLDEEVVKAQLGVGPAELLQLPLPRADAGPPQVLERKGAPEEMANVATVRRMIQALEDGQEAVFLATMTDDLALETLDASAPIRGQEAALAYFRTLRRSVRQLDTVIQNAWGVGSFAIVEYEITGLQTASLRRHHVANDDGARTFHTQRVDVVEFRAGKIARIRRYSDPLAFAAPEPTQKPSKESPTELDRGMQ
jgi:ketosteroid isomerase-like protein